MVDDRRHVGTGQRIAGQSAGLVVRVTLGQGMLVNVVLGGSVMTLVTTPVGVVVVEVVRRIVEEVVHRRVEVVVGVDGGVVGQGRNPVRKSMSHPWYGQSASQGAMSVAVGSVAGQPHGFWMVVWNVQSDIAHALWQLRFWIVRVAVGQTACTSACPRARPTRPRRAAKAGFIVDWIVGCQSWSGSHGGGWLWRQPYL